MNHKVMLLVDADNVSIDVIQQAFERVMALHGAAHVRRAYCTAESAAKHLQLFKRLSMRPMVNVSTGKNSTDIALAVDAISLVDAERPDVVVIVSSDSDFAPLVIRLREKGCRVEGIGQKGKTGEEAVLVYDDFIDIEHRKAPGRTPARGNGRGAAPAAGAGNAPARGAGRSRGGRGSRSARDEVAAQPVPASPPAPVPVPAPEPMPVPAEPIAAPVARGASRKRGRAKKTSVANDTASVAAGPEPLVANTPPPRAESAPAPPKKGKHLPEEVLYILEAVPELAEGGEVELRMAADRLRNVKMLARNAPSTRLFLLHPDHFVLTPETQPTHVAYQGPAPW